MNVLHRFCSGLLLPDINMARSRYNIFVGAETGLLKGIDIEKKAFKNLNSIQNLNRENEICLMCWNNQEETEICVGLRNQTVSIFDMKNETFSKTLDVSGGEGSLKGLCKYNNSLLTCVESGLVKLWTLENNQDSQLEINAGENICRMRQNPIKPHVIATGGKENDLKVWDLHQPDSPLFRAKNVPHDFLNLRVPIWVQDMQFFPSSEKIVSCSGHHQVRVYDPSTPQRRPVINMECGEYPLTAVSITNDDNYIIVGNSRGFMSMLDLRKKTLFHSFKGFAGSIRCIQCHPTLPLIASCGLDRFLRIHDIHSHKLLHRVYLKSRLNCLLLRSDFENLSSEVNKEMKNEVEDVNVHNDLEDKLWNEMEIISDNVKRKLTSKKAKKRIKCV